MTAAELLETLQGIKPEVLATMEVKVIYVDDRGHEMEHDVHGLAVVSPPPEELVLFI